MKEARQVWAEGGLPYLNIAATCAATKTLGPGTRAVVWVQGCPFHCVGCLSPDWISNVPARLVSPDLLADELGQFPDVDGVTFSGGEPMRQAAGLAELIRRMRRQRTLSLICFTGYTLEQLQHHPPGPGVAELLKQVDLLIDGLYISQQNDNQGLRGSGNQSFHYLSEALLPYHLELESGKRKVELHFNSDGTLMVGVPPHGLITALDNVMTQNTLSRKE